MRMKWIILCLTTLVSLSLLTGCFNGVKIPLGDGNSIQVGGGDDGLSFSLEGEDGKMEFSGNDEKFTYATDEGTATVYAYIPEHFPSELPVPNNIEPVGNFVTEVELEDGSTSFILGFGAGGDRKEEILELYNGFLKDNNYELKEEINAMGMNILAAEKGNIIFQLSIMGDEEELMATINYTKRGEKQE